MGQNRKSVSVMERGRGLHARLNRGRRRKPVPYGAFLAATLIGVIVFVGLCAVACARISQPYAHQVVQQRQIKQLQAQLDADNASNDDLQRHLTSLSTQEGIETAARGQRFAEPGEIVLNVQASQAPTNVSSSDESFGARLRRAWNGLTGN